MLKGSAVDAGGGERRMSGKLANKVALITGGGTGIGKGIAQAFLREGARVMISGRREESLRRTRDEAGAGSSLEHVVGDISVARDAERMVEATIERFGTLDILVNNAGVRASIVTILELTEEEWDRTFDIDAKGSWLCSKHAIPWMQRHGGGSIIMVNSISGFIGQPRQGCYNAAKAAQLALVKCMALDFARDGIRVNAVAPAWVETDMNRSQLAEMRSSPGTRFPPGLTYEEILDMHPIGRIGTPRDVAGAVVFLASDDAAWITGTTIMVDGGYTCR